ncbi:MAG TPA: GGDEF domain-containing protein [Candidatus Limnocylindria bacterium]
MTADQIFILVTGIVAALLGAGALLAAARRRRGADEEGGGAIVARPEPQADKYELPPSDVEALSGASYGTAVRVLWWVSIALVLIGIGLSDAFESTRPGIYLLGAAAVAVVFLVHDLLPARLRTRAVAVIEVLAALGIVTALLTLTGHGTSPFAYAYALVAVAVALAASRAGALLVAAAATLAFLGVLWVDPARDDYGSREILGFGLTIGSIWLLAYLASVFASAERTIRGAVEKMSRIDPLTGLFNSSQLYPMLEQEVQRTRRSERGFCLLMIDLDGLKAVNDTYGHHRGDEVLRALGNVIRGSIRNLDTAYRLHGDEFMVLLPETDIAGAFVVAEKVRTGAEEVGLAAGSVEMLTSVSIGLVSCPEDGTSADELMLAADRAMYQAKSLGKNQVSGNPRPRRLLHRAAEEPVAEQPKVTAIPVEPAGEPTVDIPAAAAPVQAAVGDLDLDEPLLVPPPVLPVAESALADNHTEEDEPDPSEVRRHIAAASRNLDPDYQIRRAMDAFLSPTRTNGE